LFMIHKVNNDITDKKKCRVVKKAFE